MREDPDEWQSRLAASVTGLRRVTRVVVLAGAESTQDEARRRSRGEPGLMVAAMKQTAGRGRLGRRWEDGGGLGAAATFVLDAKATALEVVSLGAGLAACRAGEAAIGGSPARLGLRWPNDVVEHASGRKVAGVLVERSADLWLVGVGLNVRQRDGDWPPDLRGRACSLAQLGSSGSRLDVLERLAGEVDRAMGLSPEELSREWAARDTLLGTEREFRRGGLVVRGVVESVEPTSEIVVRAAGGGKVRLPAMETTLLA